MVGCGKSAEGGAKRQAGLCSAAAMQVQWCPRDDRGLCNASLELCERSGMQSTRMRAFLAQGLARLAIAREGQRLLGFATVIQRPAEHFARVDYITTAPEARRTGVATALLDFVRDETSRSFDEPGSRYDMLLLETAPELVGFFGRRGARRLAGVDYMFPSEPPVPVALLAIPVRPGRDLPRSYLERLLTALFAIEGRAPGDPLLAQLIASLPPRTALETPRPPARAHASIERGGQRFLLRPYQPGDFERVRDHDLEAALQEAGQLDPEQARGFREQWLSGRTGEFKRTPAGYEPAEGATVLVLVDEAGEYAGHIWWETASDPVSGAPMLWVQSIAVAREQRRRGWGGALLEEAVSEARALGLKRVGLSVHADNAAGRALYAARGFRAVRITMEREAGS